MSDVKRGRPRREIVAPPQPKDRWLSTRRAREVLAECSEATLYRVLAEKDQQGEPLIKAKKLGGRTVISEISLRDYIEAQPDFISRTSS